MRMLPPTRMPSIRTGAATTGTGRRRITRARRLLLAGALMILGLTGALAATGHRFTTRPAEAATDTVIYSDGLASGWSDWSWSSSVDFNYTGGGYSGARAISWRVNAAWAGLYLHTDTAASTASGTSVQFAVWSTNAKALALAVYGSGNARLGNIRNLADFGGNPPANSWKVYNIALSNFGAAGQGITGIALQDYSGSSNYTVIVDEVKLLASGGSSSGVSPTPVAGAGGYFKTLPPGTALPSGDECAARVRRSSWEPRPENYTANHTKGVKISAISGADSAGNSKFAWRMDGNFTGTTDEIIQWGACKWGFDEDTVRAQAQQESYWRMSQLGDNNTSFGILQIKSTMHPGTYPASKNSTAFNVDYVLASRRACFEGHMGWLTSTRGDEWGCIGAWYSGAWYDGTVGVKFSGAKWYIQDVKDKYYAKIWKSW